MRIDGVYGPGIGGVRDDNGTAPKSERPEAQGGAGGEPTELYAAAKQYVLSAAGAEEVNRQSVAEARELLRSGKLDSPEAARRAAEAILSLGI